MLGLKFQPLDDGEVLLFMAFCSCQKLLFPMNYSCTKTWSTAPKSNEIIIETSRKLWKKERNQTGRVVQRKRKEIRWGGVHAVKSYFFIRCGRNPVILWWSNSNQFPSDFIFNWIPYFITFQFSPWSKKILWIRPANLGKNPSHGRNPCFHTR